MKFKVGDVVYHKLVSAEFIDGEYVRTIVEVKNHEYAIHKQGWPNPRTFTHDYVEGNYRLLAILNSPLWDALK